MTDTIDRARWEQLADANPNLFEDEALEVLGFAERADDLTATMLDIAVNAGDGDGRCLEAYDVFLSFWAPLRALQVSEANDGFANDRQLIKALVRVVLTQEERMAAQDQRIAALEARLGADD